MKTAWDILQDKGQLEIYCVPPETTVREALRVMTDNRIGAILVKQGDQYVGIWTERDLLWNSVDDGFEPSTSRIADVMVTDLVLTPHDDTVFALMDKLLGRRHRRMLIEKDGELVGFLSAGDVMKACLQEKSNELDHLKAIVSWEYYEDWKGAKRGGTAFPPGSD